MSQKYSITIAKILFENFTNAKNNCYTFLYNKLSIELFDLLEFAIT